MINASKKTKTSDATEAGGFIKKSGRGKAWLGVGCVGEGRRRAVMDAVEVRLVSSPGERLSLKGD